MCKTLKILLFILAITLHCQIYFSVPQHHILQEDLTRLRNNPLYIIEGRGALSIFLKNNVESIYQKWGHPNYRSFSGTERLFYKHPEFTGFFQTHRGFIEKIHIKIDTTLDSSYYPFTKDGFHSEILQKSDTSDISKMKILKIYQNPKFYNLQKKLIIYSHGITYGFSSNKLTYIEIFKPYQPFDFID